MKLEPAPQMTMIMRSALRALTLAVAIGLFALAGCGSSSSTTSGASATKSTSTPSSAAAPAPGGGSVQILNLAADPEGGLKYNTTSLSAKPGTVSIAFTNNASVPHNLTVASSSGAALGASPTFQGGAKSLSLSVKAGTYKFYCTVPGHRAAGMEGTLTVK